MLHRCAGRAAILVGMFALAGASLGQKADAESDPDRVEPAFKRGMLDNPDGV